MLFDVCDAHGVAWLVSLEVYNDETAPLIDFYSNLGAIFIRVCCACIGMIAAADELVVAGCLRTFEVKKGLADLDKLVDLIKTALHV